MGKQHYPETKMDNIRTLLLTVISWYSQGLFEFFPDLPDMCEHLFREGSNPVVQVVLDLPEPGLLIKKPDHEAEDDVDRDGYRNDLRQRQAEMDGEEILEQFGICRNDPEVQDDLCP